MRCLSQVSSSIRRRLQDPFRVGHARAHRPGSIYFLPPLRLGCFLSHSKNNNRPPPLAAKGSRLRHWLRPPSKRPSLGAGILAATPRYVGVCPLLCRNTLSKMPPRWQEERQERTTGVTRAIYSWSAIPPLAVQITAGALHLFQHPVHKRQILIRPPPPVRICKVLMI